MPRTDRARRLAFDDDQGRGHSTSRFDSRITRKFLPAGTYTVEATTYGWIERHSRHITGDYILHITADHTPAADGQPDTIVMTLDGDKFVHRTWSYKPSSTKVKVASVMPSELVATVVGNAGSAAFSARPWLTGDYTVRLLYENGRALVYRTTEIEVGCSARRVDLDRNCATPKPKLDEPKSVRLVFPPSGFAPKGFEQSNRCLGTKVAEKTTRYLCRRPLVEERAFVAKNDPRVLSVSEPRVDGGTNHGRMLLMRSAEGDMSGREGCQSVTRDYWQCDYRAERIWTTELDDVDFGDLAKAAVKKFALGQLSATAAAAKCAAAILALYASVTAGGTFSPLAGAAVFISCPAALPSAS